mgnify:FL=1
MLLDFMSWFFYDSELWKTLVLLLSYTFWRYFNLLWHKALQFYQKIVGSIVYAITAIKIFYASSKCWHKMRKHCFLNNRSNNITHQNFWSYFFLLCNSHLLESIFWICFRALSWETSVYFSFIISSLSLLFSNSHKKVNEDLSWWNIGCFFAFHELSRSIHKVKVLLTLFKLFERHPSF